ncbi:flippase [Methanobrevibacter olleyae]|uniref:Membrane protein involved in the export of O-antigen and teichoic acid n=1 Tax=Methanobrevibacter olleyae TaxID=294671 RepID=A0A126R0T2_METOL|nr:flippase [Methanobrevibacter olleyae]AMK15569.1 polysaccharide biosynthesis protein [Methanobrevibacter olleyae]SFL78213.1 Membrane protein involved in the export of O-antigen and teichoic acid [Methanobrevibacter olleyae]
MSEIKTLFKNISWVASSQLIVNICAFLWTIAIARYLGVNDYGILSFAISFTVLLGMGTDIGMSTYTTRKLSQDKSKTQKFINNLIPFKIILSLVIFILTALILFLWGYNKLTIEVALIISIETIFICMIKFIGGVFQAYENQKINSIGEIITSVLLLLFTLLIVVLDLGLVAVALSYALAYLAFLIYMVLNMNRSFGIPKFEFDLSFWKDIAIKSIPFGLSIFFYTVYFSIDVVMIKFLSGNYATGIYNAAYKIVSVFVAFYVIYQYVIFPLMSKLYAENTNLLKVSFEQSFKYSLLILLPINIGVYLYSPYIINLIYSSKYALASPAMQILIWTVVFLFINGVATSLLNSIGKELSVTKIYLVTAIFNIILNYLTIPIWSYIGASITTVLSEILILVLMLCSISKTEYRPDFLLLKTIIKLIICGFILFIVLYLINVSLWLAIPIGLIVYILALIITKTIDDTDKYIINELLKR